MLLFFSIISIVFYFVALALGSTEENVKGKILSAVSMLLALANFYLICTSDVSGGLLWDIVLGALHFVAILLFIVLLVPTKKGAQNKPRQESSNSDAEVGDRGTGYTAASDPEPEAVDDEQVNYAGIRLGEGLICNVRGERSNFTITMSIGEDSYDFRVQDGRMVAYQTSKMKEEERY